MDRRHDPARPPAAVLRGLYEIGANHAPQVRLTPAQFVSEPVSPNTAPGLVTFTIDMRHPDAETLDSLHAALELADTA